MKIGFGEWMPDVADQGNPAVEAKNVIPSPDGYRPLLALATSSDALDSVCIGAISVQASNGTIYSYAGSTNNLYELRSGVWTNRLNYYFTSQVGSLKLSGSTPNYIFDLEMSSQTGSLKLTGATADYVST